MPLEAPVTTTAEPVSRASLIPLVGSDLFVARVLVARAEGVLRLRWAAQTLLVALDPAFAARPVVLRRTRGGLRLTRLPLYGLLESFLLLRFHVRLPVVFRRVTRPDDIAHARSK